MLAGIPAVAGQRWTVQNSITFVAFLQCPPHELYRKLVFFIFSKCKKRVPAEERKLISVITSQVMWFHRVNYHAPQYFEEQETIYHAEILNVLSNKIPDRIMIYCHVISLLLEIDWILWRRLCVSSMLVRASAG